jgi:hypothetical protein
MSKRRQPGTTVSIHINDDRDLSAFIKRLRNVRKNSKARGGNRLVAVHGSGGNTAHIYIDLTAELLGR